MSAWSAITLVVYIVIVFDDEVEEHKDRFHELKKELEQFDLDINKIKDFYIELYYRKVLVGFSFMLKKKILT